MTAPNPLLQEWEAPFGLPPFDRIEAAHFRPAFTEALRVWRAEIEAIAEDPAPPDFANTVEALERAGALLGKVARVFFNLCASDTSETLQAIESEIAPELARASSEVHLDPRLFGRIRRLWEARDRLELTAEQRRVLTLYHESFTRAGAELDEAGRARMSAIAQRLAALGAEFAKRVLQDESAFALVLESEDDRAGLPDFVRSAAAQAARERGLEGKHVVTASRSLMEPFLSFSTRRDLREAAWRGWVGRGVDRPETATAGIIAETLALRSERAALLGHDSFAAFKLAPQMAGTPEAVRGLLERVWAPARARAEEERAALQDMAAEEGGNFALQPWDWRFYAQKRRKRLHDLDEAELKPYFALESMIEAAFDTARRLFGLRFVERPDLPRHHPDVRVWEALDRDGAHLGVFMGDYFARASKRSGAWMSAFREQRNLDGRIRPIIVNTMNFARGAEGEPTLLTFEDARTLFHEFGHGLHGLMSDVTYPRISGTSVARDFVELPSQLFEHWLTEPAVLKRFARHHRTGVPLPDDLIARLRAAQTFNKGCETVEYLASAIVDLETHAAPRSAAFDVARFEEETLARIGMPAAVAMRHRSAHFSHLYSGDGYAAGYYSYLWSEVMDADAFGAFEEAGDPFDPETAARLAEHIYSAGGRAEPEAAYRAFRGRAPDEAALLRRRGLAPQAEAPALSG